MPMQGWRAAVLSELPIRTGSPPLAWDQLAELSKTAARKGAGRPPLFHALTAGLAPIVSVTLDKGSSGQDQASMRGNAGGVLPGSPNLDKRTRD